MARYGLYIDISRCIGCYGCVVACKNWYQIKAGLVGRKRIMDLAKGEFPNISRQIFPVSCMQCDNAPCVSVCPTGAIYHRKDSIITINPDECVGCKLCITACPYQALYFNPDNQTADGCNLCAERINSQSVPFCVESCSGEAMVFGDLDDPKSEISKRISSTRAQPLSPQLGTKPKVYYANMTFVPQFKAMEEVTAERQTGKIFRSIAEGASV
jgi:Fe-S-cluster-containing dehydrogenase component